MDLDRLISKIDKLNKASLRDQKIAYVSFMNLLILLEIKHAADVDRSIHFRRISYGDTLW